MRTRDIIETEFYSAVSNLNGAGYIDRVKLEVLLDIRDLLVEQNQVESLVAMNLNRPQGDE